MFNSIFLKRALLLLCLCGGSAFASPAILVTGDSLSAAYGIPLEQGWVALLQARLKQEGYPHYVVNTSVSGETTSGGLARLPGELERHAPGIVIVELGANDGLRGQSLEAMQTNLKRMVELSQQADAKVLLIGMRLPSNYGPVYTEAFFSSFQSVAEQNKVALLPFLLADIALEEKWFQPDGIHPTAEAQPVLLEAVWSKLQPLLESGK